MGGRVAGRVPGKPPIGQPRGSQRPHEPHSQAASDDGPRQRPQRDRVEQPSQRGGEEREVQPEAGSPSGIAATARVTAVITVSRREASPRVSWRMAIAPISAAMTAVIRLPQVGHLALEAAGGTPRRPGPLGRPSRPLWPSLSR